MRLPSSEYCLSQLSKDRFGLPIGLDQRMVCMTGTRHQLEIHLDGYMTLVKLQLFEQLGESRLEGAVTTDICGKSDSFAVRLDSEAVDVIKKARLHRKAATAIFFESILSFFAFPPWMAFM